MGDAADIQCAEKRRTRERTKDEDQIRRTVQVLEHIALLLHTMHYASVHY